MRCPLAIFLGTQAAGRRGGLAAAGRAGEMLDAGRPCLRTQVCGENPQGQGSTTAVWSLHSGAVGDGATAHQARPGGGPREGFLADCIPESSARINVRGPTRRRMFDPRARRVYHAECSRMCSADLPDHVRKPSKYGIGHQACTRREVIRCGVMAESLWRSTHAGRYSS